MKKIGEEVGREWRLQVQETHMKVRTNELKDECVQEKAVQEE